MSPIAHLMAASAGGVLAGLLLAALPVWRLRHALRTHGTRPTTTTPPACPTGGRCWPHCATLCTDGHPVGLVLLDLDRFKAINDRHGHEAGNDLLTRSGSDWPQLARPVRLAARLSGDEFALLVARQPGHSFRRARSLAVAVATAAPVTLDGGPR